MPFRSGALSVRRFRLEEPPPESLSRTATMAIRRHAYKPIQPERGERESFGWVNPRRLLDNTYTWDDIVDGNLVFLAVRKDKKTFNKTLFKARRDDMIETLCKQKGIERITRQHRLAIEEELTVTMLKEVTPTTAFTELVWDTNTDEVLMGATSRTLCERIADLFQSTFDRRLLPLFPSLVGWRLLSEQGLEEGFAEATEAAAKRGRG